MNDHQHLQELLKAANLDKTEVHEVWRLMKEQGVAAAGSFISSHTKIIEPITAVDLRPEPIPYRVWGRDQIEEGAHEQMRGSARLPVTLAGALMPDAHQGYGLPIGGVLATDNVVIPYAVGVDIACFSGTTRIPLLDGRDYSLETLATRETPFPVYACKPNGKIVVALATAFKTRANAPMVQVKLDNGEIVVCTPDHQFMLRDGSYCEAQRLHSEVSLMPFYSKMDQDGYTRVMQNYSGAWLRAHWMVARSGLMGSPKRIGQKVVIHHIDFCKTNNLPENLTFMGESEHASYHRSLTEKNSHWQSEEFEEKRKQALSLKAQTEEGHAYFAERGAANLKIYWRRDHQKAQENCAGNGQRGKVYLIAKNQSEPGRQKSREIGSRVYICDICGKHIKSAGGMGGHYARTHQRPGGIRHLEYYNHKVVSVTFMEGKQDVYCLNVPNYENFAISSGVFVHNCRMMLTVYPVEPKIINRPKEKQRLQDALVENTIFGAGAEGLHDGDIEHPLLDSRNWNDLPILRELRLTGIRQIGTSGTGNHFVEWCDFEVTDPSNPLGLALGSYLALLSHSGSRGVGYKIATYYSELAMSLMPGLPSGVKHLAWLSLDSAAGQEYWHAMQLAGEFASANHHVIHERVAAAAGLAPIATVENHHNFAWRETIKVDGHKREAIVHRKGATPAGAGVLGIIPGSMGDAGYVIAGKGSAAALNSASHGAGRLMSRNRARNSISPQQQRDYLRKSGVTLIGGGLDESPQAYKRIEKVIAAQADLVQILGRLQPRIVRMADDKPLWKRKSVPGGIVDAEGD